MIFKGWSRRTFLARVGGSGLATLASSRSQPSTAPPETFLARALGLAAVYESPDGALVGHLAPDSVYMAQHQGSGYRIEHGWLPRTAMQPIAPYMSPPIESADSVPFWAELIAPSSVVRGWCSGRAPALAALGYGAVIPVIGTLIDDYSQTWYESAPDRWVRADHFARVAEPFTETPGAEVRLDLAQQTLRLYSGRRLLLEAAYYGGSEFAGRSSTSSLTTSLHRVAPGDTSGIPWQMRLESGISVYGAFHHNQFGLPTADTFADIELPVGAAKAIYQAIGELGCVIRRIG